MPRQHNHLVFSILHWRHSRMMNMVMGLRIVDDWLAKLVAFFIPIFIFQLGQKWQWQSGIILLALYSVWFRAMVLSLSLPLAKLIAKFGTKPGLFINIFCQIGYWLCLLLSQSQLWWLLAAGLFQAVHVFLQNTIYYVLFSHQVKSPYIGRELGLVGFCLQLIAISTPVIGGILITNFGFAMLFLVGLIGIVNVNKGGWRKLYLIAKASKDNQ